MRPIAPWFEKALDECSGRIDEISGPDHNPRILEYFKATSLTASADEVPWCAAFVSWCIEKVGVESSRSARARSYLNWGTEMVFPAEGCIVVLRRGPNSPGRDVIDAPGHVGFLYGVGRDDEILLLGGNQGNRLDIGVFPSNKVLAFRWPDTRIRPDQGVLA